MSKLLATESPTKSTFSGSTCVTEDLGDYVTVGIGEDEGYSGKLLKILLVCAFNSACEFLIRNNSCFISV